LKSVLNDSGQGVEGAKMQVLVRYRAMESLCRQSAVFHPLDSWRLLAQAEMWHHKALEEIASRSPERHGAPAISAAVRKEPVGNAADANRSPAG
jgi:hypothetical protein